MDIDKTVEMVTREVMKRLRELSLSEETPSRGKILILDSLDNLCLTNFIAKLKNLKYEVEGTEGFNQKFDMEGYKYLIVPILENRELSNISLGVSCGVISETIINGTLQGKEILLLEEGIEYRKYAKTCNKLFYSKLLEHENNLRGYGIKVLKESDLFKALGEDEIAKSPSRELQEKKEPVEFLSIDKKILTEMDLQRLCREGTTRISIKKRSIITPLAMDFIKLNNIEIIRTE